MEWTEVHLLTLPKFFIDYESRGCHRTLRSSH